MKKTIGLMFVMLIATCLVLSSCKKEETAKPAEKKEVVTPAEEKTDGESVMDAVTEKAEEAAEDVKEGAEEAAEEVKEAAEAVKEEVKETVAAAGDLVPLPIELPKPMFEGTPKNINVPNLEKPLGHPRPDMLAPKGVVNVALNKPVTSTDDLPIIGEIEMITDGDKSAADGSYVELGPAKQHVTIDLEEECTIYAVLLWHFHKQACVYNDVIVQIADDADFITNVRTIYNNDHDNSYGLGVGKDMNYIETSEGRLVDAKGEKARYVRLHSNGSNANDLNHYIEVEVFGKTAE